MIGTRMVLLGMVSVLSATAATAQSRSFDGEITSGSIVITINSGSHEIDFDISGTGFRLIGAAGGDFHRVDACTEVPGCLPGETVSLSAAAVSTSFGEGIAVVNGETLSPAYYSGGFALAAGTATIPAKGNRRFLRLSAPFSITLTDAALLRVFSESNDRFEGVEPWAQGQLFGSGIATVFLERMRLNKQTFYRTVRVVYNFGVS